MAALNLSGKTSGYIKLTAPDVASNATVELPNKSGIIATLDDVGSGGGGGGGTGGGVEAQPPVAFNILGSGQQIPWGVNTDVILDNPQLDTDNGYSDNTYVIKKEGIYQINGNVSITTGTSQHRFAHFYLKKNDVTEMMAYSNAESSFASGTSLAVNWVGHCAVGDVINLVVSQKTVDESIEASISDGMVSLSGHMVSSITEGEVKEKEAVVLHARASAEFNVPTKDWQVMPFDNVVDDTDSGFDTSNYTYTPKTAGYYYVTTAVGFNGIVQGGCSTELQKNGVQVTNGLTDYKVTSSDSPTSRCFATVYMNGTTDSLKLRVYNYGTPVNTSKGTSTYFDAHLITGQSSGGGSGGGDYTPEKMVWEDKLSERTFDTVYTNTNDVPIYVQPYVSTSNVDTHIRFYIDGVNQGVVGNGARADQVSYHTPFYVVPSGSTYKIEKTGTPTLVTWHEARMPVAVGTGGKTVAFKGEASVSQTISANSWTKVNIDKITVDTSGKKYGNDSDLVDGSFKPSVAGWYQVNGSVGVTGEAECKVSIVKNNDNYSHGNTTSVNVEMSDTSHNSDIVYLDGKEDFVSLEVRVSPEEANIDTRMSHTHLSAVLVSGGSASGDSIWTEEDGKAVYDGDVDIKNNTLWLNEDKNQFIKPNHLYDGNMLVHGGAGLFVDLNQTTDDISLFTNNQQRLSVASDGNVVIKKSLFIEEAVETAELPNMRIAGNRVFKSTTAMYSAKEVDKKLAIKDKLIEKLEARLDKLEEKLKKVK